MTEFLKNLPLAFIPIFVAIDIFGVLPIFLSMTHDVSVREREKIVKESVITALFVSVIFIAVGEAIFGILGITDNDFKIAGGLLLLVLAVLDLVRDERRKSPGAKVGIVPIGVPLIVGPAVLTTLLVLVPRNGMAATIVSLLFNLLIVWFSFKRASVIIRVLGSGGIMAVSKIMSLLLASIAVMMIRLGISNVVAAVTP